MDLDDKIKHATALIRYFPGPHVLLCSFGKDSMVLLHLIKSLLHGEELRTHGYPIPVIYHRNLWFPVKNEFADSIIRSWSLEVYSFQPAACGVKCKPEELQLVELYPFGTEGMHIPIKVEEPQKNRDFGCGLNFLKRVKSGILDWPWVTAFIGHKDSDVDPYEGPIPLAHDAAYASGVNVAFPLRRWTDDDIWQYIEWNHVPYDKRRYVARLEVPDHTLNPDYLSCCTKCIDPREQASEVMCPKLNKMVPNISGRVLRLDQLPPYIKRTQEEPVNAR